MDIFKKLINPGDTVIEVGGHIGYISLFFSDLVGQQGKVYVFEPGKNNLFYTHANLDGLDNVQLIEKAVSDSEGSASLFIDKLSGQNNSLLSDYPLFYKNRERAFPVDYEPITVETTTLTRFIQQENLAPDFIKIDTEGVEPQVLAGLADYLKINQPIIMVEVTLNRDVIHDFLLRHDYTLFDEDGRGIEANDNRSHLNTFAIPKRFNKDDVFKLAD